jgi:translocator protein
MTLLDVIKLIFLILLCLGVGWLSSQAGPSQTEWYRSLIKPPGQPPDWMFGVVWTILYLLMAIAAWLVWWQGWNHPGVKLALGLFALQLLLNFLWSPAFFGMQSLVLGLVVIIPLLILIGLTTLAFFRVNTIAGVLMLPYLLWVGYATYLNAALLVLNRPA